MCFGCWAERDYPQIENVAVLCAVPLIAAVFEESPSGGNLHVVIEDWNLETEFCQPEEDWTQAEKACGAYLVDMTEDERASALARYEGWEAEDAKAGQVEDENFAYGGPCPVCGKPWSGRCGALPTPAPSFEFMGSVFTTEAIGFCIGGHCVRVGNARNG